MKEANHDGHLHLLVTLKGLVSSIKYSVQFRHWSTGTFLMMTIVLAASSKGRSVSSDSS